MHYVQIQKPDLTRGENGIIIADGSKMQQGDKMRATIDGIEYVDVSEAAAISGYSQEHVRRLARQETIDSVKTKSVLLIAVASLESYVHRMKSLGTEKFSPKGL